MRPVVDVVDMLTPVLARDATAVHLAFYDWNECPQSTHTLCGQPVHSAARATDFLLAGCLHCAEHATGAGIPLIRDDNAVVGLRRLIEQRTRS